MWMMCSVKLIGGLVSEGIHRMRVNNYYVYFWIDEENNIVDILAVMYVARD